MSTDFDCRLAVLRARFLERAGTESEALDAIAARIEGGAPEAEARPLILKIAHRLAGASGTFGFSGIGLCAEELQDFVSDVSDPPDLADACRTLAAEIRRGHSEG